MIDQVQMNSMMKPWLEIGMRRKWTIILVFVFSLATSISLVVALPPLYRASATMLIGQDEITESLVTAPSARELVQRMNTIQQAILSRSRLQEIIEEYDLYSEILDQSPMIFAVNRMRQDISIELEVSQNQLSGEEVFPLTISYQSWNPELAARISNAIASLYQKENEAFRLQKAENTTEFLRQQLQIARERLSEHEGSINQFKTDNLGGLPEQESINLATLERLNSELRLNGEKQIQLMDRRSALTSNTESETETLGLSRLDILKLELNRLLGEYTEQHPEIIRRRNQIAELEEQSPQENNVGSDEPSGIEAVGWSLQGIENELAVLREQEGQLREQLTKLQQAIEYIPRVEQELRGLTREYESARQNYLSLQERYQNALLAESLEQRQDQQFRVLETAIPPEFPIAPDRLKLFVMCFVISAVFAGGIVIVREQIDTSFHTMRDIRNFTKLPVLGGVTRIETTRDKFSRIIQESAIALGFTVCTILIMILFHYFGESRGEQIVWLIAGNNS